MPEHLWLSAARVNICFAYTKLHVQAITKFCNANKKSRHERISNYKVCCFVLGLKVDLNPRANLVLKAVRDPKAFLGQGRGEFLFIVNISVFSSTSTIRKKILSYIYPFFMSVLNVVRFFKDCCSYK